MLAFGRELARTAAAAAPASLAGLELGPRPAAIAQSAPIAASLIASKAFDTFRRAGAGSLPGVLERSARLSPPIAGPAAAWRLTRDPAPARRAALDLDLTRVLAAKALAHATASVSWPAPAPPSQSPAPPCMF
eukprot:tig00000691_g3186.t1